MLSMIKVMSIFGTRPEAIKMAPVISRLSQCSEWCHSVVCVTAQHRNMLDQALDLFRIVPDYDLDIMSQGQNLFDITCHVLQGLKPVLERERPDLVLVHGDTTTTMAAALASFYCQTPVAHVEAGLRTHNKSAPFPEELNRRVSGVVSDLHFAPTENSRQNLLREGVDDSTVYVTGNTVVDALLAVSGMIASDSGLLERFNHEYSFLDPAKKLILVTCHRRESFGAGFENISNALANIAEANPQVEILYPVHLNPNVQKPVMEILGRKKLANVHLIKPVDYLSFAYLMNRSYLIITDSGGVQEEAPSLNKPVLVIRDNTERTEALEAGTVRLVGTDREKIVAEAGQLLSDKSAYQRMAGSSNPYGDGRAAERIVEIIKNVYGKK
jgi:UDP-N-acetylglucosamine 2-epimerase (non-hydrolysing)